MTKMTKHLFYNAIVLNEGKVPISNPIGGFRMGERFYVDIQTDESTKSRSVAMRWYRDGHDIEVWQNGRLSMVMYALI